MAYVEGRGGKRQLAVRGLDRSEETTLLATEGALTPIFSPDAQWIAFFTETELKKVPLLGGTPTTVSATPPVTRGATGPTTARSISVQRSRAASRAWRRAAGGRRVSPRSTSRPARATTCCRRPCPGPTPCSSRCGKAATSAQPPSGRSPFARASGNCCSRRPPRPRYVPPGFLVFARDGALFAVRFDPEGLAMAGEAVPVVDGVWNNRATGTAHFAVRPETGPWSTRPGGNTIERRRLVWVDRQGRSAAASRAQLLQRPEAFA